MASSSNQSFLAEIYTPRDWEGLYLFLDEISDYLRYLDRPFDFDYNISNGLIRDFDENRRLQYFDPWQFSEAMENRKFRENSIKEIILFIDSNLTNTSTEKLEKSFYYEEFNVKTNLLVYKIQNSNSNYRLRNGSFSPPVITGYAPEGMFELLVKKRILTKLNKKQLYQVSGMDLRVLIIDISHLAYWMEFKHQIYFDKFRAILKRIMSGNHINADIVLFCTPRVKTRGGMVINLIFKKDHISNNLLQTMLGNIQDEVIIS